MQAREKKEAMNSNMCTWGPVAVIGAGITGASWAAVFAGHGLEVRLCDRSPERLNVGAQNTRSYVGFLARHRLVAADLAEHGLEQFSCLASISRAVRGTTFVQEAVSENYEAKRAVFAEVDRHTPASTLISTSSSGLSIGEIQKVCSLPQRCLAGHPYNPPHIVPLVEIAPGGQTSPETIGRARRFYESIGKVTVILSADIPGYLANRMSAALWREAINLVLEGVASVEDVDKAIRYGPGLRWAVMGPHLLYHLGGGEGGIRSHIAHLKFSKERIWSDLKVWESLPEGIESALERGLPDLADIHELMQTRDESLAGILKALKMDLDSASPTTHA